MVGLVIDVLRVDKQIALFLAVQNLQDIVVWVSWAQQTSEWFLSTSAEALEPLVMASFNFEYAFSLTFLLKVLSKYNTILFKASKRVRESWRTYGKAQC